MKIPLKEILEYFHRRNFPVGYNTLCLKHGEKKTDAKIDKACRKDYVEYGVSQRTGWLTQKGLDKLRELKED